MRSEKDVDSQESGLGIKDLLSSKREEILRIAAKHGASNVRIFGSVARGEAGENSDIDLLVELEQGLYWLLRRRILKEARPL